VEDAVSVEMERLRKDVQVYIRYYNYIGEGVKIRNKIYHYIKSEMGLGGWLAEGWDTGLIFSGKLYNSIKSIVRSDQQTIKGRVYTNVPYAKIHEFGGEEEYHRDKLLDRFLNMYKKRYNYDIMFGGYYPKRSFFAPAYRNWKENLLRRLAIKIRSMM